MNPSTDFRDKLSSTSTTRVAEFWLAFTLPWVLDWLGGNGVMASLFGALLWGAALAISATRLKTQDQRLQHWLVPSFWTLVASWLVYWAISFSSSPSMIVPKSPVMQLLVVSHAALLAAGFGMVLVSVLASLLWWTAERKLRQNSFERRKQSHQLPSLESSEKLAGRTWLLACISWGTGFALAMVNAFASWQYESQISKGAWLLDSKILFSFALFVVLLVGFQWIHSNLRSSKQRVQTYTLLGLSFLVLFVSAFVISQSSQFHEPVTWFFR